MVKLKRIGKLADKLKWMNRFRQSYSGAVGPLNLKLCNDPVKFLVAVDGDNELGFIRMGPIDQLARYTDKEVWLISEAYVKPAYRSRGVLREMITLAVRDHGAKGLHIETSRFAALVSYYVALDFTQLCATGDPFMSCVFLSSLEEAICAANDDQFQQAA